MTVTEYYSRRQINPVIRKRILDIVESVNDGGVFHFYR